MFVQKDCYSVKMDTIWLWKRHSDDGVCCPCTGTAKIQAPSLPPSLSTPLSVSLFLSDSDLVQPKALPKVHRLSWPISTHSSQCFVTVHLKLNAVHSVLLVCHLSLTLLQLVHFKSMLLCHHSLTTHPSPIVLSPFTYTVTTRSFQVNVALSPFTYNSSKSALFCHHSLLHFKIVFSKESKGKVCILSDHVHCSVLICQYFLFCVTDWKCRTSEERTQPFPE